MKWTVLSICVALLLSLAGCASSPYVDGYYYIPRPIERNYPSTEPAGTPAVSTYVTVVGIHRGDKKQKLPESLEVRVRIENNGQEAVHFDADSMQLTTGNLIEFPKPIMFRGSDQIRIEPDETGFVDVLFPFPGARSYEDFDLRTVMLRWVVQVGRDRVTQSATFRLRRPRYYYYYYDYGPYWYYYPYGWRPYYHGAIVVHHHH